MGRRKLLISLLLLMLVLLSGCRFVKIREEERQPLEYEIVGQDQIPEELAAIIRERKTGKMQMTYQRGGEMYLVKGYGQQLSGGYSIQVEELGESGNGLFFITRLLGPKDLSEAGVPSYPSIVIKTRRQEKPVTFREGSSESEKVSEKGE